MLFRLRRYTVEPGKAGVFTTFFVERMLPIQKDNGAILVGQWKTEDDTKIYNLWVYESMEQCQASDASVMRDPRAAAAGEYRQQAFGSLYTAVRETFMTSAIPLEATALAHLVRGF
jgi:hypothetical protein